MASLKNGALQICFSPIISVPPPDTISCAWQFHWLHLPLVLKKSSKISGTYEYICCPRILANYRHAPFHSPICFQDEVSACWCHFVGNPLLFKRLHISSIISSRLILQSKHKSSQMQHWAAFLSRYLKEIRETYISFLECSFQTLPLSLFAAVIRGNQDCKLHARNVSESAGLARIFKNLS